MKIKSVTVSVEPLPEGMTDADEIAEFRRYSSAALAYDVLKKMGFEDVTDSDDYAEIRDNNPCNLRKTYNGNDPSTLTHSRDPYKKYLLKGVIIVFIQVETFVENDVISDIRILSLKPGKAVNFKLDDEYYGGKRSILSFPGSDPLLTYDTYDAGTSTYTFSFYEDSDCFFVFTPRRKNKSFFLLYNFQNNSGVSYGYMMDYEDRSYNSYVSGYLITDDGEVVGHDLADSNLIVKQNGNKMMDFTILLPVTINTRENETAMSLKRLYTGVIHDKKHEYMLENRLLDVDGGSFFYIGVASSPRSYSLEQGYFLQLIENKELDIKEKPYDGLDLPDKTQLTRKIYESINSDLNEENYTVNSWNNYRKALENAIDIWWDNNSSGNSIESGLTNLLNAIDSLQPVDLSGIKNTVNEVEQNVLPLYMYSIESWNEYETALKYAKGIIDRTVSYESQNDVDQASESLMLKYNSLVTLSDPRMVSDFTTALASSGTTASGVKYDAYIQTYNFSLTYYPDLTKEMRIIIWCDEHKEDSEDEPLADLTITLTEEGKWKPYYRNTTPYNGCVLNYKSDSVTKVYLEGAYYSKYGNVNKHLRLSFAICGYPPKLNMNIKAYYYPVVTV